MITEFALHVPAAIHTKEEAEAMAAAVNQHFPNNAIAMTQETIDGKIKQWNIGFLEGESAKYESMVELIEEIVETWGAFHISYHEIK